MKKTDDPSALSPEEQARAAINKAIQEESKTERPGPDELIDRGEIDELVSQNQYIELRELTAKLRAAREKRGLSLVELSERAGPTRAAISRLENGWNVNPTLETLYRYTNALGVDLKLMVYEPSQTSAFKSEG